MRFSSSKCSALACFLLFLLPQLVQAQAVPSCSGTDERGASEAFEAGNALMQEAATEARARHRDRARALAADALVQFDRQCELGDASALAERGAALMLMGEMLRSAQSYDAYLRESPLDSLDARTRRRIEPNLQPGSLTVELTRGADAHLFVDDLDFGPIERADAVRLPYGSYAVEARTTAGDVLVSETIALSAEAPTASLAVTGSSSDAGRTPPVRVARDDVSVPSRDASGHSDVVAARNDFTPWYVVTGTAAGVFLVTAIGLQIWADERARTFNAFCVPGPAEGCEAVRTEYDGLFGAYVTSYVLFGLGLAGLGAVLVLDLTQPSAGGTTLSCMPGFEGGVVCGGSF